MRERDVWHPDLKPAFVTPASLSMHARRIPSGRLREDDEAPTALSHNPVGDDIPMLKLPKRVRKRIRFLLIGVAVASFMYGLVSLVRPAQAAGGSSPVYDRATTKSSGV